MAPTQGWWLTHRARGTHAGLASWCWLLSGGLSAPLGGFLHRMPKCPHIMAAGFLQNERMQERSDNTIYDLTLDSHYYLHHIL